MYVVGTICKKLSTFWPCSIRGEVRTSPQFCQFSLLWGAHFSVWHSNPGDLLWLPGHSLPKALLDHFPLIHTVYWPQDLLRYILLNSTPCNSCLQYFPRMPCFNPLISFQHWRPLLIKSISETVFGNQNRIASLISAACASFVKRSPSAKHPDESAFPCSLMTHIIHVSL